MALKSVLLTAISVTTFLGAPDSAAQQGAPDDNRDWAGMRRDLGYLVGWQVVATVIIYNAPFEFSNWSRDEKDNLGFKQWSENVTDPVWDKDHWGVNYLLHPYWGGGYYIRGRERGFSRRESFWIAALYSTVYEFGIESFLEQPSIQDIIVTPVAGAAVGMYFETVRDRIRSKTGPLTLSRQDETGIDRSARRIEPGREQAIPDRGVGKVSTGDGYSAGPCRTGARRISPGAAGRPCRQGYRRIPGDV